MSYDVVVIGEPMLEFSAAEPLTRANTFTLSFSGDALNAAVAAAAAGVRVALLTRLGRDELADRLVDYLAERGVDTALVRRENGQTGAYVLGADPGGTREFAYLRAGSAATRLVPSDVDEAGLAGARAVLLSGITAALSASCAETVRHAARTVHAAGGLVVYDPNFRGRLTTAAQASSMFAAVAPYATVVTPSVPADTSQLLGLTDPVEAAAACRRLGAAAAVITCGADGVLVDAGGDLVTVPVVPAPSIVDSTGAGDAFAGTLTARLAAGDDLLTSVRLGMAAASLSLGGQGGTGRVPTLTETRSHLAAYA
jgi:2-dehydro-3-deoxygluconokinase